MSSTYSTNLALELIGTGDQAGNWGATNNLNLGTLLEQAVSGYVSQAINGVDVTLVMSPGASATARNMYIVLTGSGAASLIVPTNTKLYFIHNTASTAITVKVSGQTGVSVPVGAKISLVCNGTDIVNAVNFLSSLTSPTIAATSIATTSITTNSVTFGDATTQTTASKLKFIATNSINDSSANLELIPTAPQNTYKYLMMSFALRPKAFANNLVMNFTVPSGASINWTSTRNNQGTITASAFSGSSISVAGNLTASNGNISSYSGVIEVWNNTTDADVGTAALWRITVYATPNTTASSTNSDTYIFIGHQGGGPTAFPAAGNISYYCYINSSLYYGNSISYGILA